MLSCVCVHACVCVCYWWDQIVIDWTGMNFFVKQAYWKAISYLSSILVPISCVPIACSLHHAMKYINSYSHYEGWQDLLQFLISLALIPVVRRLTSIPSHCNLYCWVHFCVLDLTSVWSKFFLQCLPLLYLPSLRYLAFQLFWIMCSLFLHSVWLWQVHSCLVS